MCLIFLFKSRVSLHWSWLLSRLEDHNSRLEVCMSKDINIWIFGCFLFTGSIISLLYQMVLLFMVLERETTRFELEILRRKTWTCSKVLHAFNKTRIFLLAVKNTNQDITPKMISQRTCMKMYYNLPTCHAFCVYNITRLNLYGT